MGYSATRIPPKDARSAYPVGRECGLALRLDSTVVGHGSLGQPEDLFDSAGRERISTTPCCPVA